MLDKEKRQFPKVGVFLIAISSSGKWLLDIRGEKPSLPFKELSGGESWEQALTIVKRDLAIEKTDHSLAGIGAGKSLADESWVYCVFKSEAVSETSLKGYQWVNQEKVNGLEFLSHEIQQAYLRSPKQVWAH